MNKCYVELDLNIYPFKKDLKNMMLGEWKSMSRRHHINDLSLELINFFHNNNVKLMRDWILIHWYDDKPSIPHTDGEWFSSDPSKKRLCGINWNFTPGTWVEFYDSQHAVAYKRHQDYTNVFWKNIGDIIAKWDTAGPAIINAQIPHAVRGTEIHGRRISCSLNFLETYESITNKLGKYIKK